MTQDHPTPLAAAAPLPTPPTPLAATIQATQAYATALTTAPPPGAAPPTPASPAWPDAARLARETAPTVSRLIARAVRERRLPP